MKRKIPILLYHRVGERDGSYMDKYTVSPKRFAAQMEWIRRHGWRPIPLESVVDGAFMQTGERLLAITFDDGFASNREHAWPILNRYGFPSATFVVTELLGSCNRWDGASRRSHPLLAAADLESAASGPMRFHSHGATHADLRYLRQDAALWRRELENSRRSLAGLRASGQFFAYPWGGWNWAAVCEVARAGYVGALTCDEGLNMPHTNPYLLRRVEIREGDIGWTFWLKVRFGRDFFGWLRVRPPKFSRLRAKLRRPARAGVA